MGKKKAMTKLLTLVLFSVMIIGIPCHSLADNRVINDLIYGGLGIDTGHSEAQIIRRHGQPETRTAQNQRPESPFKETRVIELRYKGFSFTIHRKVATGNPPLETVTLTRIFGPNIRIKHGLKIGAKVADAQAILGTPDEISYDSPKKYDYLYFPRVSTEDMLSPPKGEMLILSFNNDLLVQVSRAK